MGGVGEKGHKKRKKRKRHCFIAFVIMDEWMV